MIHRRANLDVIKPAQVLRAGDAFIGALDVGGELVGMVAPEIERDRPDVLR